MYTSVAWINDYLDPPATDQEQADLLTQAGFPLEEREEVSDDVRQDFEMTSNRGDCTCHVGLAREIAAASNRTLIEPSASPVANGDAIEQHAQVSNESPEACPLYTARVIRGVKVEPSPPDMASRLVARGDIPRNNIVDSTNFVLFELGQPTHVFDLDKIAGGQIIVRMARAGERFLPIGEDAVEIELDGSELVIADAEKPVALAGVKGGALTAVTDDTTNILIEAATFDPVAVRHTSRRHNISSDSSFRFERWVSPAAVNPAAERLVDLILTHAGGSLSTGVCSDGAPLPKPSEVQMRTERFRELTGLPLDDDTMVGYLDRLGFQPRLASGQVTATVPYHRGDIGREVDLIEEVVRMHGFDAIDIPDEMRLRPAAMPPSLECHRAISRLLVGADFIESITHTLVSEREAGVFLNDGEHVLRVEAACAGGDSCLRPSVLSSLLRVRRFNLDQGMRSLSLFEWGSTFHSQDDERSEQRSLAMLCDAGPDGLRPLRGVLERLTTLLCGPDAVLEIDPGSSPNWYAPGGQVRINKTPVGWAGRLSPKSVKNFGIDEPMMAAELHLDDFMKHWPPDIEVRALPAFPSIERDLSAIVSEETRWQDVRQAILSLDLPALESVEFVTVYRGKGIDPEHKSMTLRLRFRAEDRTLRSEEVDDQVPKVLEILKSRFHAEIRT
ncbi:MAG: phenylalanine--tRNA ligase subunit beta [Planctomycetota bacterium]|nr:phenylalanine--tRNA ligase subunit beta [Planctomycetota bacterium]